MALLLNVGAIFFVSGLGGGWIGGWGLLLQRVTVVDDLLSSVYSASVVSAITPGIINV